MVSAGYTKLFDAATRLKRSQPCVLGYIKSGKLSAEKGADGHWYINDLSLQAFIERRDLKEGARALTEVDALTERVAALEARIDKLTVGMKAMLAHMKQQQQK